MTVGSDCTGDQEHVEGVDAPKVPQMTFGIFVQKNLL